MFKIVNVQKQFVNLFVVAKNEINIQKMKHQMVLFRNLILTNLPKKTSRKQIESDGNQNFIMSVYRKD